MQMCRYDIYNYFDLRETIMYKTRLLKAQVLKSYRISVIQKKLWG